jgi:uncharacterized protein YgiM (DUF1202 family)
MKNKFMMLAGIMLCVSCVFMGTLTASAARMKATVSKEVANVRAAAGTSNQVVCKLSKGMQVTVLSEALDTEGKKWYEVYFAYNGGTNEGFIRADLVSTDNATATVAAPGTTPVAQAPAQAATAPAADANTLYVRCLAARVRGGAGTDAGVMAGLVKGTAVTKTGTANDKDGKEWTKISYKDAKTGNQAEGYVRSDLLTADAATAGVTVQTAAQPAQATQAAGTTTPAQTPATAAPASNVGKTMKSKLAVINVRGQASATANLVTKVKQGTTMSITSETTGADGMKWYGVSFTYFGYSFTGYVRSDLVE